MANNHRHTKVTREEFPHWWRLRMFRHLTSTWMACGCRRAQRHGFYNRAAFKRGEDYVHTIRRPQEF